ncbi:hypothetical protein [Nocardia brasiliensis]|uniref:hypothetical protein n=1 Tax=Nocardia brasiliensis TaxID=37326 RepID=UPI002457B364|nr:hypothetical protein [Nocardia brasiliensis]
MCDLPALPVEDAVAEHYRALRLPSDFAVETRARLEEVLADEQSATREMHTNLNRQLEELDKQENRLVDLLADGSMPQAKIRMKLIETKSQRTPLHAGLIMVDLAGRYSNRVDLREIESVRASIEVEDRLPVLSRRKRRARAKGARRTSQRLERRLLQATVDELVQAYGEGASTAELAERYGVSKSAVLALLIKRGVRRYQSMTEVDIDHAEQLYLEGHSLVACSRLTGFPASSINHALHKRGTPMRPAGRRRASTPR